MSSMRGMVAYSKLLKSCEDLGCVCEKERIGGGNEGGSYWKRLEGSYGEGVFLLLER